MEPSGGSTGGSRRSSQGSNAGSVTHEDGITCVRTCVRGGVELSEWQHSPPGAPHTSSPNSSSRSEPVCDADSGCWTSPVSSDKHSQVALLQYKDDAKHHGRVGVSPDRQQRHLEAKQCDEQKSPLSVDEERVGATALLSSSPRIQEALIKRLEVGRDKGMLVEMKMAAKMHKRKAGPEVTLPLKAVRNNADTDAKLPDKNDIESLGLVDELKDNDVPTAQSRIPVFNCKRSNANRVVDADITVLNKDTVVVEDGNLSKAPSSDDGKPVCRKTSIKRQSSLRSKRDGSSDREDGIDSRTGSSVRRRRGSVGSRSSSHSRRGSVESVTGAHGVVTDIVARNDSEDSLSGRDSSQNSPSAKQKDSSLDGSTSGRRRLGCSPSQSQLPARRDVKPTADSGAATMADDTELENVLLEAGPFVPVPPPGVNTRQRRTSGSPMRRADRTAVSDRLKEDGGSTRPSADTVDSTKHRPISWHVEQGAGDAETRSARRKIRTGTTEKRSCSVGAVDPQPEAASGVRLTQKPPVVKAVSRDVVGSRPTRRRAYSEHSSPARTADTQQGSSPTSATDVPTPPKTVRTHRRYVNVAHISY